MEIGLVGIGKMGFNLAKNMIDHKHRVFVYDINENAVNEVVKHGAIGCRSIEELVEKLPSPKIVWLMLPAGEITITNIELLGKLLSSGDILIDGGNSYYKDTIKISKTLEKKGIYFLDIGTSGGISGAKYGACMMIGGEYSAFKYLEPLIKDICVKDGYLYAGKSGSGHFLKMVHNGIEYGMMQSIAEGFAVLKKSDFDFDLAKVAKNWNHGSVIRSWLIELMEEVFLEDPQLESIKGVMHSSGEGQWTVETALELKVRVPVIATSVMMRYRSLEEDSFSGKVVAALRNKFGGHPVETL